MPSHVGPAGLRGARSHTGLLSLQLTERQRQQQEELQGQQEAAAEARLQEEQQARLEELEARRMAEAGYRNKVGAAAPGDPNLGLLKCGRPEGPSGGAALRGRVLGLRAAIREERPPRCSFPEGGSDRASAPPLSSATVTQKLPGAKEDSALRVWMAENLFASCLELAGMLGD